MNCVEQHPLLCYHPQQGIQIQHYGKFRRQNMINREYFYLLQIVHICLQIHHSKVQYTYSCLPTYKIQRYSIISIQNFYNSHPKLSIECNPIGVQAQDTTRKEDNAFDQATMSMAMQLARKRERLCTKGLDPLLWREAQQKMLSLTPYYFIKKNNILILYFIIKVIAR